jgi:hypothetical protein
MALNLPTNKDSMKIQRFATLRKFDLKLFKETVLRDLSSPVYSIELHLLVPLDMSKYNFYFFPLYYSQIYSIISVVHQSQQSRPRMPSRRCLHRKDFPLSDAFAVLASFTGVNDTAEEFLTVSTTTIKPSFTAVNVTSKF